MEKTFRTSMFGFNKDDVAKYIYQQDRSFEKKLSEKNAALEAAESSLEEARGHLSDWNENVEKIKALRELLERFREQSVSLSAGIEEGKNSMDAVENGYKRLEDRCEKLESFREKANKFDSLATALSGIFGNGIKNEPVEQDAAEETGEISSPIHQAMIDQESIAQIASELDRIGKEIESVIEDLRV